MRAGDGASKRKRSDAAQAAEIRVLRRIIEALGKGYDLQRVTTAVVDIVVEELGALNASLYLVDADDGELHLAAARGAKDARAKFYPDGGPYRRFRIGEGVLGWVAREGKPQLIDDVRSDERFVPASPISGEVRSLLAVPVVAEGEVVAVLNLSHSDLGAFSKDNEALLSLASAHAGVALANVSLFGRLAVSERKLRELFSRANDALLTIDGTGHVVDANKYWEDFAGAPRDRWDELKITGPEGRASTLKDFFRTQAFVREGVRLEAALERPGGLTSVVEISSKAFPFDEEETCLVLMRDVTEAKRLAEQLIKSEKLAAIGEVTASLAHEVNNPLGALYNSVCLLKSDLKLSGDNGRLLEVAVEEATHLSEIVNDFLSFARFPQARFEKNDVNQQVSNALFLMKRDERMGAHIEVGTDLAQDLPQAEVDKSQFQEVLFNLISNALDAMPTGGRLTLKTYHARLEGRPAAGLMVEDTGVGIPEENRQKIFAPFFTTKDVGTGLGLAIVKRIVEEHRGTVTVGSEVGKGTRVSVVVPVSREEALWRQYS